MCGATSDAEGVPRGKVERRHNEGRALCRQANINVARKLRCATGLKTEMADLASN